MKDSKSAQKEELQHGFHQGNWIVNPREYKIREGYNLIRTVKPKVEWSHLVWHNWAVPKHRFIAWLVYMNALNTRHKLKRIGVSDSSLCCLCEQEEETVQHLFFDCAYSRRVMGGISEWLGLNMVRSDTLQWVLKCRHSRLRKRLLKAVVSACVYGIWKQRNECRLEYKIHKPECIVADIRREMNARCLHLIKIPVHGPDANCLRRISTVH
ncbi:uncharacterized protein LOC141628796 [Silene latifolia]|uniref:uncharacterized protein LOC141628796 n=1 Tax=Silene latifolia TaxID=37657 RepID=UPI003D778CCC